MSDDPRRPHERDEPADRYEELLAAGNRSRLPIVDLMILLSKILAAGIVAWYGWRWWQVDPFPFPGDPDLLTVVVSNGLMLGLAVLGLVLIVLPETVSDLVDTSGRTGTGGCGVAALGWLLVALPWLLHLVTTRLQELP